ncbi:tRNA N(3)-methylcytidine methyltransferase METTL6 [Marchantia polymorpha subsp. ruderalis]
MAAQTGLGKEPGKVQIYPDKTREISNYWRDKYEKDAKKYWDIFYKRNENRFFKDRHYLDKEWGKYFNSMGIDAGSAIADSGSVSVQHRRTVLEVGCGTGNTVFPLTAQYPDLFVYACDFSPRAVDLVKAHEDFTESRVKAFVCDATSDSLVETISPASVDVVTLVFMLSAVGPDKMPAVVRNVKSVLKPGGHILLRDYAVGDLAQERLMTKDQMISENFYVRGDGTRAYYFSEEGLKKLFADEGLECKEMVVHNRQLENRARKIKMDRRWIQSVFYLPEERMPTAGIESQVARVSAPQKSPTISESGHVRSSAESASACPENGTSHEATEALVSKDLHEEELIVDLSEGAAADLFGGPPSPEPFEVVVGKHTVHALCLNAENQHTFAATGFMLWESALALATLLAVNPSFLRGKTILEVGCGSIGLCSLIASLAAEKVFATDGDSGTMDLLRENLHLNEENFPVQKIAPHKLYWGHADETAALKASNGNRGFDLIIGSDVTYVEAAVPLLFETARSLLRETSPGAQEPQFLLCHRIRGVSESEILSAAAAHGFRVEGLWTSDGYVAGEVERRRRSNIELLFKEGLEDIATKHNSLRLLLLTPSS